MVVTTSRDASQREIRVVRERCGWVTSSPQFSVITSKASQKHGDSDDHNMWEHESMLLPNTIMVQLQQHAG